VSLLFSFLLPPRADVRPASRLRRTRTPDCGFDGALGPSRRTLTYDRFLTARCAGTFRRHAFERPHSLFYLRFDGGPRALWHGLLSTFPYFLGHRPRLEYIRRFGAFPSPQLSPVRSSLRTRRHFPTLRSSTETALGRRSHSSLISHLLRSSDLSHSPCLLTV